MNDDTLPLNPMVLNSIQSTFVDKFSNAFSLVEHHALVLFYALATIELVFFGLIYALKQQEVIGALLFKIIKIGFIFFIISNYQSLLKALIDGFTALGFAATDNSVAKFLFAPAKLWQFGFDAADSLLEIGVQYSSNLGAAMLYMILGFGTLILFALIGVQIILLVVSFYVLSLFALVLIPFGSFTLTEGLFYRAARGVFVISAKIFGLILVLGGAVAVWSSMNITAFATSTTIDQPLGLFFSALVFCILAWKIPGYMGDMVGNFGGKLFNETSSTNVDVSTAPAQVTTSLAVSQVAAASTVHASAGATGGVSNVQAATVVSGTGAGSSISGGGGTSGGGPLMGGAGSLATASHIEKGGISRATLNKLKSTFKQALKENK